MSIKRDGLVSGTVKQLGGAEIGELILAVSFRDELFAPEGSVAKSNEEEAQVAPIKCPGKLILDVTLQDFNTGERWTVSCSLHQRHMIAIEQNPLWKTS